MALAKYETFPVVTPAILCVYIYIYIYIYIYVLATFHLSAIILCTRKLPDATISSHVDMKFVSQTINLFRCHPTITEHTNLDHKRLLEINQKKKKKPYGQLGYINLAILRYLISYVLP